MTPEDALRHLIAEAEAMLAAERRDCLAGGLARLAEIAAAKQALIDRLEDAIGRAQGTPELRRALSRLVAASRQNEAILLAARAGIVAARRRIATIEATRRGDVAYAADGTRIVSRDDAGGKTRHA